jgi:anthranilate/para-aminobenzoate synthase component II
MQALVHLYGGHVGQVEPAHGEVAAVEHDGSGAFAGLPTPFAAVRYHSLAALDLPDVLRQTAFCADPSPAWGFDRRVPQVVTGQRLEAETVVMGVEHRHLPLWGVQFHPESILTEHGSRLVANFLELG